ncbi:BON domain-containing protein [bacterium]|nr:BON domain-containing protein [bacterium]
MSQIKRFFSLPAFSVLLIAMVLGLSSCASSGTSRSAGEALDDGVLTSRVNAAIAKDATLADALDVEVEAYQGVVQLSGFIDSQLKAVELVQIVEEVEGVESVTNSLQIKPST